MNYRVEVSLSRVIKMAKRLNDPGIKVPPPFKLNFGPGPNWIKPDESWLNIDIEPAWGDIVVNFQKFKSLPLTNESCLCVYGSHVFEHMSIFKTPIVFQEIHRVLKKGGVFRLILPDAEKSIREYINRSEDFLLFKRRKKSVKKKYGSEYTLFECMRDDFISRSSQPDLIGENPLAHQNAWDFQTIKMDLRRAGFEGSKIQKMDFKKSNCDYFKFEGTYSSEANEDYRSLYVEVTK